MIKKNAEKSRGAASSLYIFKILSKRRFYKKPIHRQNKLIDKTSFLTTNYKNKKKMVPAS